MNRFARALQVLGLIIVPMALGVGLGQGDERGELTLLGIGGFFFLAGYLLQRKK